MRQCRPNTPNWSSSCAPIDDPQVSTPTVDVQLRPSARAHRWLFWIHVLPLVLLPLAMPAGPWMVGVAAAIGISWMLARRHRAFGHGRGAIHRVTAHGDGRWTVQGAQGDPVEVELAGDTLLAGRLLVLNVRGPGKRRLSRVLVGDEAEPELLRRLRARLASSR